MRYFTHDRYEKMQLRGRFPIKLDSKENWIKQWEEFYRVCHINDKEFNTFVFQHILEVKDYILQGKKFTDKEVTEVLFAKIREMANDWEIACRRYRAEYEHIKSKLPLSIQEIGNYGFHDDKVLSLEKCTNNMITFELQRYSLRFKNVRQFEIKDDIIGYIWIYDEVYLTDSGNFDFQVLLRSSQEFLTLHEFRIIADDLLIEDKGY